jgi:hypothetical protein
MSFDDRIIGFAGRFLTVRTFRLVVAPAVADLQFEDDAHGWRRTANRLAVLRAVAGGMREDLAGVSSGMVLLTLLPACYYIFLLVFCFDLFAITIATDFVVAALLILVLSFAPVMVCFWPERQPARPVD